METKYIQVAKKEDADLIKKFLSKMQSVISVGTSKNKRLNKFIEELEMEQDIKDLEKIKASSEEYYRFEDVVDQWKKEGTLMEA